MLDELKAHLTQIGLSHKEAAVYLALLQTRTSSPQALSAAAHVNRSTTYLALEGLQKRGLVSSVEKDGKVHLVAEHPERLARLVESACREVELRRVRIETAMPHLLALFQASGQAPRVRYFEGEEALQRAREDMLAVREPLWEVYAAEEMTLQVAKIHEAERIKSTRRIRDGRLLIAIKPGCWPAEFDPVGIEARCIDYTRCPFSGSITLAGSRLCIITRQTQGMGVLVDSQEMTGVFRAMFEAVWATAKPYKNTNHL